MIGDNLGFAIAADAAISVYVKLLLDILPKMA